MSGFAAIDAATKVVCDLPDGLVELGSLEVGDIQG
jgi:hypothetical protein